MTHTRTRAPRLSPVVMAALAAAVPLGRGAAQRPVATGNPPTTAARAADELLRRPVTINVTRVTRDRAIDVAATSAKVLVQYQAEALEAYRGLVTLHLTGVPLREVLDRVLAGTNLRVVPDGPAQVAIVARGDSQPHTLAQAFGVITGRVTDSASGRGLARATVEVRGAKLSAVTSADGQFTVRNVPAGKQTLAVRLFGYRPVLHDVTIEGAEPVVAHVVMAAVPTTLTDVVTTATGQQRRLEVGNDITVLNVDSLRNVAPINSVTGLLESRVPGLVVMHSSGQPGAPSRIRLRGASSVTRSNDPIVVVDGVRMYAEQSTQRNVNVGVRRDVANNPVTYATPSPLDQLDPNSIETIEVLKGPSASAMYGSDAGNGVIVITTKKGRSGPTTWSLSDDHGLSFQPGGYPVGLYRFGHDYNGSVPRFCYLSDPRCTLDSVVKFQALNDPRFAVTSGHGFTQQLSGTLSGGVSQLTYSLTGSLQRQTGQLKLPDIEVERFTKFHGGMAPPNWMRHPDRYSTAGGSSTLTLPLGQAGGRQGAVALTNSLFKSDQQQSSLQSAIGELMVKYADTTQLDQRPLITEFYDRATSGTIHSVNALMLNWPLFRWLPLSVAAGMDLTNATDQALTPRGFVDTLGYFSTRRRTTLMSTLNANTALSSRLVNTVLGFNLTNQTNDDISGGVIGLPVGVNTPAVLGTTVVPGQTPPGVSQSSTANTTYGWFLQPTLNLSSRFFVSPGFRLDGGSASGSRVSTSAGGLRIPGVSGFPKIDFSYLAIDPGATGGRERRSLLRVVDLLRLRGAFGTAGVQPGAADHLRTFAADQLYVGDGGTRDVTTIAGLGNTVLRPERSRELEGGFDAELWHNRLGVTASGWQKMRYDAILPVPVAPSVMDGVNIDKNVGQIRTSGTDVTLAVQVLRTAAVGWHVSGSVSRQASKVLRLVKDQAPIDNLLSDGVVSRVIAGYPLNGKWVRPILDYADVNHDGIIQYDEVLIGDSLAYVGQELPNYEATINTDLTLFHGRLGLHTTLSYQNGLTQFNQTATRYALFDIPGASITDIAAGGLFFGNDPSAPMSQQAAYAAYLGPAFAGAYGNTPSTAYGLLQTVNVLRWESVSVNYTAPEALARLVRARHLTLALQGRNLGLHTNYRGKDPNVNAFSTGESVMDSGQLPLPRTFSLRVTVGN